MRTQPYTISLALLPEQHTPQVISPTSLNFKVKKKSVADGDDDDLIRIENLQLGQASSSPAFEVNGVQTARGDPGVVQ